MICKCDAFKCDESTEAFVCASDNQTYPSECHLNLTSCVQQTPLTIVHTGSCGMYLRNDNNN